MQWGTRALLALTVLALLIAALLWVVQRPQFSFRRIEVLTSTGEPPRHVSEASLRAVLKGQLAGNFFTMDLAQTRRLFETVPWVARASVRRVWPDQLVVTVDEHQALGLWDDGRVLSTRGVLFVANPAEAELDGNLVAFSGPPDMAPSAAAQYRGMSALLAPVALTPVSVEVSERASWAISTVQESTKGPRIELGRDEPAGRVQERLRTVVAAWSHVVA